MNLTDLCVVADVNSRFRQNSQDLFASTKFKHDFLRLIFSDELALISVFTRDQCITDANDTQTIFLKNLSPNQKLLRISKFLRNFGMLVESIHVIEIGNDSEYGNHIFGLISLYCAGTLTDLEISICEITGEIETSLRPLFRHLHMLSFVSCQYNEFFARMLSSWLPELRELKFMGKQSFITNPTYILGQAFPKLVLISFWRVLNVDSNDLEEFLKLNPQLKKISLIACPNIDGSIFQSIATHVQRIEAMQIDSIADGNFTHFGQLNSLSTLKLWNYDVQLQRIDGSYPVAVIPSILYEIHTANIPLQHLRLGDIVGHFFETEQLIDAISKLKTLKTLFLMQFRLETSHILHICKQLQELPELILDANELRMTPDDLIELI